MHSCSRVDASNFDLTTCLQPSFTMTVQSVYAVRPEGRACAPGPPGRHRAPLEHRAGAPTISYTGALFHCKFANPASVTHITCRLPEALFYTAILYARYADPTGRSLSVRR